jgi:predicted DNA binding protein
MLLHTAIQALRPDKEFTMFGDDPSTIIWNDQNVVTPTKKEIEDKYAELLIKEQEEIENKLAKKESAKSKLAALGLTEAEIQALIG